MVRRRAKIRYPLAPTPATKAKQTGATQIPARVAPVLASPRRRMRS
jgi:hypothetical protein